MTNRELGVSSVQPVENHDAFAPSRTAHLRCGRLASDKINQCRVLRDVIPPTPPGPEGSNGNGLVRAQ